MTVFLLELKAKLCLVHVGEPLKCNSSEYLAILNRNRAKCNDRSPNGENVTNVCQPRTVVVSELGILFGFYYKYILPIAYCTESNTEGYVLIVRIAKQAAVLKTNS